MLRTKSGKEVSKIGIGTWTISKDNIDSEIETLKYYYDMGVNYIDVVLAYDNGNTLDVIAEFLKQVKREDIYVNALITFGCSKIENMEEQINTYLKRLNLKYLDCVTLHSVAVLGFSFEEYVKEIERLRKTNKFLAIGYSNLSPEQLALVKKNTTYFEGLYNLECKINEDTGLIKTCQENGINFYAYQPLRRNKTAKQNYKEVVALANKYGKTQNQIIINWLVKHKQIGILIKSSNKTHIQENLAALSFDMNEKDYKILDRFRNKEFDKIEVSYTTEPEKIRIDQLPNQHIGVE